LIELFYLSIGKYFHTLQKYEINANDGIVFGIFLVILRQNSKNRTMGRVKLKDKVFEISISEAEILQRIKVVAEKISKDMEGKNPLLLAVLNGSFIFAADLMRMLTIPCEISFVKLASYQGTTSTGVIKEVFGINEDISGRTVIIVEDIVESGLTIKRMIETLGTRNPESIHICTLLLKPERLTVPLNIEYVAMEIPNDFIVGYGLDYSQQGRNLRDIYTVVES
jgi:hypoxanthine phosphoribosyltransferase